MTYCGGSSVKWFTFVLLVVQVLSAPKTTGDEVEVKKIFSESKRDVAAGGLAPVPLFKSPLFNPYLMYPPLIPGKPLFVPPFLPITTSDILLNRFGKSVSPSSDPVKAPIDASDPSLMSAYFKAKKDEFLTKLFEKITNTTSSSGPSKRAASDSDASEATKPPPLDSSFFLKKKYEFLDTLFKKLNVTPAPPTNSSDELANLNATTTSPTPTAKPTIVSPDFWFPFAKLPKPTKAPKPTKPPKAKKILKDALDTILLQSLLIDMGVDPKDASLNKRAATLAKSKSKKVKPVEDPSEFLNSPDTDSAPGKSKMAACISKLIELLNKTADDEMETDFEPKTTSATVKFPKKPSDVEYPSKLDAFFDMLIKSLNTTDVVDEKPKKPTKSFKSKIGKKIKRSTFLDELLHRVTPSPPTTTTPEPTIPPQEITNYEGTDLDMVQFLKDCCGCGAKCLGEEKSGKSLRSLIFKPFGSGYWIPQYLYAAKMGMYLDKLMDSINRAAANEVESESSDMVKRSADASDDLVGLPAKEAAINLIIAELTELKNDIVDAFAEGVQAQKDATPTKKPFGPGAGKSFKKPFWGPKAFPTTDPVAPIQKRIDILNDVFDKLTKVEKTLIFTTEPEYDPKLLTNLTEILELNTKSGKFDSKALPTISSTTPDSPEYFLNKTREFLKTLYGKTEELEK